MDIDSLKNIENLHLKKLDELVQESIQEETLLSRRLLDIESDSQITFGEKLSDTITEFGGSWFFIIIFFLVLFIWIIANLYFINSNPFDPYPFILLNLVLSCIAAIQAPIIMMSQNRQEDKDRKRARNDFMVNMKAEIEIRNLHAKIDLLLTEQMQSLFKVQEEQLQKLNKIENSLAELQRNFQK